jgi:hypothetical protein
MNNSSPKPHETDPKPEPSPGPLKNEPTPERAAEEKKKHDEQASELSVPKPSGAV